jgi:hypothetical protein
MPTTAHHLCGKHGTEWASWLDYRQPPPPVTFVQIGRPDPGAARRRQFESWRDTIRTLQALIVGACRDGKGCGPAPDPVPSCLFCGKPCRWGEDCWTCDRHRWPGGAVQVVEWTVEDGERYAAPAGRG